jgi:LysM repeat protein
MCLITIILLAIILSSVATASAADRTHVVQPGETLSTIARLYGLTVEQLAVANGITNPDRIYAGQVLVIPGSSGGTGTGTTTSYTVVPGDTLFGIARRFGTTVTTLASMNGLTNVNVLYIGQVLLIPSQGGQPVPTAIAPTSAPQPTSTPVETITYTVQRGDTLSQIALRYGTTYQTIMLLNNLTNPDLIFPGQVLVIRQGTVTPPTSMPGPTSTATGTLPPALTPTPTITLTPTETPELTATYPPGFSTPTPIVSLTRVPANAPNLLANPGFEGPTRAVGGNEDVGISEQWQPFYCDQPYTAEKCRALRLGDGNRVDLMMVRPSYRPTSETTRVHGGASAQQWSCAWTACRGGVYQTVQTRPGAVCEAGAFVQSWSSDDMLSFTSDLVTRADRENATWFIIVDPAGGANAYADAVLTSRGFGYDDHIYDQYTSISYTFTAAGSQATVFFENLRLWPLINNTNYLDDAYLRCTP